MHRRAWIGLAGGVHGARAERPRRRLDAGAPDRDRRRGRPRWRPRTWRARSSATSSSTGAASSRPSATTTRRATSRTPTAAGELDQVIVEEAQRAVALIDAHRPFPEIVYQLGRVAHFVADANNPLNAAQEPREARYFADYLYYMASAQPRFAPVFYGVNHRLGPRARPGAAGGRGPGARPRPLPAGRQGVPARRPGERAGSLRRQVDRLRRSPRSLTAARSPTPPTRCASCGCAPAAPTRGRRWSPSSA